MENTIKEHIKKSNFKIVEHLFKAKVGLFLGYSKGYFLKYNDKFIFLGLKRDIDNLFRGVLKDFYGFGNLGIQNVENNFFKHWIHDEYLKSVERVKKTELKKKPYYKKQRIRANLTRIKNLKEENERLKKCLKN